MTAAFRNQIDVKLSVADQVIVRVDVQPRTRPPLGRLFAGKPAETLLAALPRLFALCASAHQVALISALEAAREQQATPLTRHRRLMAVIVERFAELLRGLLVGPLVRDRSAIAQAQQLLQAIASLQARSGADGPRQSHSVTLSQIKIGLATLGIGLAAEPVLPGTPVAAIIDSARKAAAEGGWKHMSAEHRVLSAADDVAIVAKLMDGGARYAEAPELDGRVPETGVWARQAAQHSLSQTGPVERLSARIAEIRELLRWIEAGEDVDDEAEVVASYAPGQRRGAAAVECARGRLHHAIELDEQGHIACFEFLAPTEWNFHPRGPVVNSLTGAALRGGTDLDAIDAMVGSFDPCVGYHLVVQEIAHA